MYWVCLPLKTFVMFSITFTLYKCLSYCRNITGGWQVRSFRLVWKTELQGFIAICDTKLWRSVAVWRRVLEFSINTDDIDVRLAWQNFFRSFYAEYIWQFKWREIVDSDKFLGSVLRSLVGSNNNTKYLCYLSVVLTLLLTGDNITTKM